MILSPFPGNSSGAADVLAAFGISFAAVVLQSSCKPFVSPALDQMKMLSLLVICITQYTGIVLVIQGDSCLSPDAKSMLVCIATSLRGKRPIKAKYELHMLQACCSCKQCPEFLCRAQWWCC